MAVVTLNNRVFQIRKNMNREEDAVHYYVKLFHDHEAVKEFTFEYANGDFLMIKSAASDRERELVIHCIQALELSDAFL